MDLNEKCATIAWQDIDNIVVEFPSTGIPLYEGPAKFGVLGNAKYVLISSELHASECSKIFGNNIPSVPIIKAGITFPGNRIALGDVEGSNVPMYIGTPENKPVPLTLIRLS